MEDEELKFKILRYEDRIHTANNHPRNTFFFEVKKDAEIKIKLLKGIIPNKIIECLNCDWKGNLIELQIGSQCPKCTATIKT